jgi:hypothetical protein
MTAAQWKAQALIERGLWRSGVDIVDKAVIDLCGLGIVGHPATIDDELVCHLVSPWDEEGGSFKAIGLAGEAKRGPTVYRDAVRREIGMMEGEVKCRWRYQA